MPVAVSAEKLAALLEGEEEAFAARTPESKRLFEDAKQSLLGGVPMHWMTEWASPYPIFVTHAEGIHVVDADGNDYVDFCLGDTGAMAGHSPPSTVQAVSRQAASGITLMLPSEDGAEQRRSSPGASASPTGSSPSRRPMPTVLRSGSRAN